VPRYTAEFWGSRSSCSCNNHPRRSASPYAPTSKLTRHARRGSEEGMKENDCELGCRVVVGDVKKGAGGPINDNGISPAHSITTVFLFNSFNSTTPLPCASTTQGLLFSARALSVLCVFGFFSFRPASESVVIRHGLACRWLRDNVCCLRSRSPSPFGQCTHTSQNNAASCLDEPLSAQFLSITTNTSLPTTVATFL
jgi:hypothetical protein